MFIYTYLYMYYYKHVNILHHNYCNCVNVGSINQYRKRMTEANTYLKLYHKYIISIPLVIIYSFFNITDFRPGRQTSVTLRGGSDQCDTLWQGGRGGQNWPKKALRNSWTAPLLFLEAQMVNNQLNEQLEIRSVPCNATSSGKVFTRSKYHDARIFHLSVSFILQYRRTQFQFAILYMSLLGRKSPKSNNLLDWSPRMKTVITHVFYGVYIVFGVIKLINCELKSASRAEEVWRTIVCCFWMFKRSVFS